MNLMGCGDEECIMNDIESRRLEKIIQRMKKVQRDIASDKQPVSPIQVAELERLGSEYADIVTLLRTGSVENK
jgi:hypothetical protein